MWTRSSPLSGESSADVPGTGGATAAAFTSDPAAPAACPRPLAASEDTAPPAAVARESTACLISGPSGPDRQQPPGQHVRRQRPQRRRRCLPERPAGALLPRHALPLEMEADRRRRRAVAALDRRHPLLLRSVLSGARDGDGLHRLLGLGAAAALRRRRLPRGPDRDEPRPRARRARGAGGRGRRLRRPLRGQGRDGEEGHELTARRGQPHRPALHARALRPRDLDQRERARGRARRGRRDVPHPDRCAGQLEHVPGRRPGRCGRRGDDRPSSLPPRRVGGEARGRREPGGVARGRARSRVLVAPARGGVRAQPRRPGCSAVLSRRPARGAGRSRGRAPVVHGALRPGQPHHELPGAALRSRARAGDADVPRALPGDRPTTRSATPSRERSSTSFASASSRRSRNGRIRPITARSTRRRSS